MRRRAGEAPVRVHPIYGTIPMVAEPWGWSCDPAYSPKLPVGAVAGDVSRQVFCTHCHVPKYFYVDEPRTCVQCGKPFVFRATEQKHWYEKLKFNFNSVPIRCLACRRQRRSEHALREQIDLAKSAARSSATDPAAQLSLARAIVDYHERTHQGDLDEAIAAARKTAALWPESHEPLFWEGLAHALANRPGKARRCLESFLARQRRAGAGYAERARKILANLASE